jgi:hypothetical protein
VCEHRAKIIHTCGGRHCDHGYLGPALREFPFQDRQGQLGPNVSLARESCHHPGFEIRFGLPHEPLE